jgi:hypothetical protein
VSAVPRIFVPPQLAYERSAGDVDAGVVLRETRRTGTQIRMPYRLAAR